MFHVHTLLPQLHMQNWIGESDPDAPIQHVEAPQTLTQNAINIFSRLFAGEKYLSFAQKTEIWLNRFATTSAQADALISMLLARKMTPSASLWNASFTGPKAFIINLAAFISETGHFRLDQYKKALGVILDIVTSRTNDLGQKEKIAVSLTNLDVALAKLHYAYDSADGRLMAQLMTLLTVQYFAEPSYQRRRYNLPSILSKHLHDLNHIFEDILASPTASQNISVAYSQPDLAEGLLGVETCGYRPGFSITDENNHFYEATSYRLAHLGFTPHQARRAWQQGRLIIYPYSQEDCLDMYDALAVTGVQMPKRPYRRSQQGEIFSASQKHQHLRLVS